MREQLKEAIETIAELAIELGTIVLACGLGLGALYLLNLVQ